MSSKTIMAAIVAGVAYAYLTTKRIVGLENQLNAISGKEAGEPEKIVAKKRGRKPKTESK
jgi:hypothetical protein